MWVQGGQGQGTELLTFALQTLPQEAPEQGPTVVTEGGDLVVVDTELVGHVDAEPLGAHLQGQQNTRSWPNSCALWSANHWTSYRTSFQKARSSQVAGPSSALKAAPRPLLLVPLTCSELCVSGVYMYL